MSDPPWACGWGGGRRRGFHSRGCRRDQPGSRALPSRAAPGPGTPAGGGRERGGPEESRRVPPPAASCPGPLRWARGAAPARTCPHRIAPDSTGPNQTRPDPTGPDRPRPARTGPNRARPDRTDPNRPQGLRTGLSGEKWGAAGPRGQAAGPRPSLRPLLPPHAVAWFQLRLRLCPPVLTQGWLLPLLPRARAGAVPRITSRSAPRHPLPGLGKVCPECECMPGLTLGWCSRSPGERHPKIQCEN